MSITGRFPFSAVALSVLLAACGADDAVDPSTRVVDSGDAASVATAPTPAVEDIGDLLVTADIDRGKALFFQCRACHSLGEGADHKVGPNLHGMFGRKAGEAAGFTYSDVLKNSDVIWDEASMNEWLARPGQFLPGNLMVFVGIKKPEDRASMIRFLQQATE